MQLVILICVPKNSEVFYNLHFTDMDCFKHWHSKYIFIVLRNIKLCWLPYAPKLVFWWHLQWVLKPVWIPSVTYLCMSPAVILTHCLSMWLYVPGIMVIMCPYFINVTRIYHGQCELAIESECVIKTVWVLAVRKISHIHLQFSNRFAVLFVAVMVGRFLFPLFWAEVGGRNFFEPLQLALRLGRKLHQTYENI